MRPAIDTCQVADIRRLWPAGSRYHHLPMGGECPLAFLVEKVIPCDKIFVHGQGFPAVSKESSGHCAQFGFFVVKEPNDFVVMVGGSFKYLVPAETVNANPVAHIDYLHAVLPFIAAVLLRLAFGNELHGAALGFAPANSKCVMVSRGYPILGMEGETKSEIHMGKDSRLQARVRINLGNRRRSLAPRFIFWPRRVRVEETSRNKKGPRHLRDGRPGLAP